MTLSSWLAGGEVNMKRSWPLLAEASEAPRELIAAAAMLSTVTSVSFFSPHSLVYSVLNHLSKPGTKCPHWAILSFFAGFFSPRADLAPSTPLPNPAAASPAALINARLDSRFDLPIVSLRHPLEKGAEHIDHGGEQFQPGNSGVFGSVPLGVPPLRTRPCKEPAGA